MVDGRDIVLTVNSPGEVATWLTPLVQALRGHRSAVGAGGSAGKRRQRITVLITPCTYASGTEERVVRSIPGVDEVLLPRESLRFALTGRRPDRWHPGAAGLVMHLGGEFALTARMARHLGYPAYAYTEGFINTARAFQTIFTPYETGADQLRQRGVADEKVRIIGNLMVDAAVSGEPVTDRVKARRQLDVSEADRIIALFPGSRPHELANTPPLFLPAAQKLAARLRKEGNGAARRGRLRSVLVVSPFAEDEALQGGIAAARDVPEDLIIWRGAPRIAMAAADLALGIPGSSVAELGAWGVPTIVCLPLHKPEDIPLDGIIGYMDRIPLIGRRIKAKAVLKAAKRIPYVALPNRFADRMLIPELKSTHLTPDDVADAGWDFLRDDTVRSEVSRQLVDVMGPPGAARTIAETLLDPSEAGNVGERR